MNGRDPSGRLLPSTILSTRVVLFNFFFFLMWTTFKVIIELAKISASVSCFCFLGHKACGSLAPQSFQSLSRVRLFATPGAAAHQASLSITNSWKLLKLMSIELMMPSNHLILIPTRDQTLTPALEGKVLTSGLPGKSEGTLFKCLSCIELRSKIAFGKGVCLLN